ncbi:MAG: hypothetical protein KDK39_08295 [Leptospiraceae bacterium]|nr:hypothetical protein [Leptospiraceae bacterium]
MSDETHCQYHGQACVSCCGLFNLKVSPLQLRLLLIQRTWQFRRLQSRLHPPDMVAYRQNREAAEAGLERHDAEVYVCPFLGYLHPFQKKKPGCMVHPLQTGQPQGQNFSFYGASICQGYDCPVKDHDQKRVWPLVLEQVCRSWLTYSRLVCDRSLYALILAVLEDEVRLPLLNRNPQRRAAFLELCRRRLQNNDSQAMTSFQLDHTDYKQLYRKNPDRFMELADRVFAGGPSAVADQADRGVPVYEALLVESQTSFFNKHLAQVIDALRLGFRF